MTTINKIQRFFTLLSLGGLVYLISFLGDRAENFSIQRATFTISGKCTLKDWEIISKAATGSGEITLENNRIQKINFFKITIPANSFETESYTMNRHAREALKYKKNPDIIFNLKKTEPLISQNDKEQIRVSGNLTVAGITKSITFNATGTPSENTILFQGRHPLKMSDFSIEPPTFILGGIKASDDVVVSFQVYVRQVKENL